MLLLYEKHAIEFALNKGMH